MMHLNRLTEFVAAALIALSSASANAMPCTAEEVRAARDSFNNAIQDDDLDAMAAIFDEDVVLITGTDSDVFIGRGRQIKLWRSDVGDPNRLAYLRETTEVRLSPLYPIARESGLWKGVAQSGDEVGGEYTAKWRCEGTRWLLEAEIFTTTRCSGALCDQ